MKLLVFSDVHGNRFGLEAVIEHARDNYDAALCLGDVVGYGAHPNECCELVREVMAASPDSICLMGNHDAAALGIIDASWFNHVARAAIEWTSDELNAENSVWLESLKPSLAPRKVDAFQAVHGSLRQPLEEYIVDAETAIASVELMQSPLCFYGHTHVAEAWFGEAKTGFWKSYYGISKRVSLREGGLVSVKGKTKVLVNPGSCGQPRDGNREARYAIYDSEAAHIEVFAIDYDWQAASDAIYNAGLPPMLGDRLMVGR